MKRRIPGLSQAALPMTEVPDGLYLVTVERVQYRWAKEKPYYALHFAVREPKPFVGTPVSGRLYCSVRALWKLSWFLRDFDYDTELLGRDELDEKRLVGLQGVVKVSLEGEVRRYGNQRGAAAACVGGGDRQLKRIHHLVQRSQSGAVGAKAG